MIDPELANEVITLAASGRLFTGTGDLIGRFPYCTYSFQEALSVSRLPEDEVIEPNYRSLRNLVSLGETRIRDQVYARADWRAISEQETVAFQQLEKLVEGLPHRYREATDDVLAHLAICWLSRLIRDQDLFFVRLFEVYASGFWACGWVDTAVKGDFLVFIPPKDS